MMFFLPFARFVKVILYFVVFFISIFIMLTMSWIEHKFGAISFSAILFTVLSPLAGAEHIIYSYLKRVMLSLLIVSVLTGALVYLLKLINNTKIRLLVKIIPLMLCILALSCVNQKWDIVNYIMSNTYSNFIDDNYAKLSIDSIIFSEKKKNLVFLVMESMENTFYNDEFHNLIPQLKSIQNEPSNISFKSFETLAGTDWSIAGLTSFLFGVPLKLPHDLKNKYSDKFSVFLPNALSVLDVLDANDYNISIVMGTFAKFAGTKNLITTHTSAATIYDVTSFIESGITDTTGWENSSVPDKYVYAKAKDILLELSAKQEPFFAMITTCDTHSPGVSFGDYPEPYGDIRDAFIAADYMAADFVDWFARQPFAKNTVLVVIGDHPLMSKKMGSIDLVKLDRNIYNVFINTNIDTQHIDQNHAYTSIDIAPTLLESIGIKLPDRRFGMGISLFSGKPTLVEQYGIDTLNKEIEYRSKLYNSFFSGVKK